MPNLTCTLNGKPRTVQYTEGMHFLDVLRETCGITSPKDGCAPQGYCGCCAVLVDGQPVLACLRKPEQMEGRDVVTMEGIPDDQRRVLAEAFVKEGGIQCGYCIPGIVVRAASLLNRGRTADRREVAASLPGHLCRCTGYARILDAIQSAGEAWNNGGTFPQCEPRRPHLFGEQYGLKRRTDAGSRRGPDGVGMSAARYRGLDHAIGAKPYVADMTVTDMLHGAVVMSDHARAVVRRIDTGPALAMDGIVRIVLAADVPGQRHVGLIVPDWPVFVAEGETTHCVGDVLALVVAESQYIARQAARAVRVEYDVLEPVTDMFAALEPGAASVHPNGNLLEHCAFARGDVASALASSPHVVEQTFSTQRIEHAFLEPEACLAVPRDNGLTV